MESTSPNRLPKFHHILKFTGEGRSISTPLTILTRGSLWRSRERVSRRGLPGSPYSEYATRRPETRKLY